MLLSDHLFKKERLRFFTQATFLVNCLCNERYFHSTSTALIRKYSLVESFRKRKKKFWEYFHYNISTKKKEKKREESLNVFENGQLKKVASPFKYSGLTVLTQDNFLDSQELYRYISRYRESHNPRPIISSVWFKVPEEGVYNRKIKKRKKTSFPTIKSRIREKKERKQNLDQEKKASFKIFHFFFYKFPPLIAKGIWESLKIYWSIQ